MIAALYVQKNGAYFNLPGVDPWDEERDARTYAGPWPVVAHPPCNAWSQMNQVNAARWGTRLNDDGGCFTAALSAVRRWGGVLEHPAESRAFPFHRLPRPRRGSWQRCLDLTWITEVHQAAYGHKAGKRTWLAYCGVTPPPSLDWRPLRGTHQIGGFDVTLPQLPKRDRIVTPPRFRDLLISIAESANMTPLRKTDTIVAWTS